MTKIAKNITSLIGKTPLVELSNYARIHGIHARLIAKLEYFNAGGSVKDRIALAMIAETEKKGTLKKGGTIVEPTSGNTGIGLAAVSAPRGYRLILTMPDTMSIERRNLLAALGAEVILTPGALGMKGAMAKAEEVRASIAGAVTLGQFDNPANPFVHYMTTGKEIWDDTSGKVAVLVAGVGTGGTVSGAGKRLKELNPAVKVVAVEPSASPVLAGGSPAPNKIQGIGAGFIPVNYDAAVVDEVVGVSYEDAVRASRNLAREEGLAVGFSSGAALHAAALVAARPENKGKIIVAVLPDNGERYLSTELYDNGRLPL